MSHLLAGFLVGVLTNAAIGIAVPKLHVVRHVVAGFLLALAILTAAWYLP